MTLLKRGFAVPSSPTMTIQFCERWLQKAAEYDDQTLIGAFDKFFSLFVAFNRLYSHICIQSGRTIKGDRKQATNGFANIVGTQRLVEALDNGGSQDVTILGDLIQPGGSFYLISDWDSGQPDVARNRQLYEQLRGPNPANRARAVLKYLYLIRCNMFHGSKDFDNKQLEIIRPATRCLERIVRAGLRFMRNNAV